MAKSVIHKIRKLSSFLFRKNVVKEMRMKNKLSQCSILSSNCIGGLLLHDLGLRFDSPTVNLFFSAEDFVKFLSKLDYYLSLSLSNFKFSNTGYPIAMLDDITLHFVHYKTFEDCQKKWQERKGRIDFSNLVVIFTDRNGLTYEKLQEFLLLPYKKIVYVSKKEYCISDECIYIPGYEKEKNVPDMEKYADMFGHRYYEKYFDIVSWLNNDKKKI